MTKNLWTFLESMPAKEFERAVQEAEGAGLYGVWIPQLFSPPSCRPLATRRHGG